MFRYSLSGCLALVAVLQSQGPALAQSLRERNTASIQSAPVQPATSGMPDLQQVRKLILTGVNQFRSQEGRSSLRTNKKLAETADYFAHYLASTDKFSHTADGNEPWERAAEHGYSYCIVLENIAYEFNSEGFTAPALADAFVQGWEHSPGHRRNMLDPDVGDTGIGVARNGETGRYYAVQMFGRPRSESIAFRLTNNTGTTVPFTLDKQKESIRPGYTVTFTRCRPPKVQFHPVSKPDVFHPTSGAHLVLVPRAGGYQVQHE